VVGRPIPRAAVGADRNAARERFGIPPDARCLLVFGGSLGAWSLNEAAIEAFARPTGAGEEAEAPSGGAELAVLHASGRRDYHALTARLEALGAPSHYHLYPYIEPFADALAAADLAAARAGGSIFELAAAGVPAVLVPYPHATADHQTGNARWMAEGGAATVVPDPELDERRLAREVGALLGQPERLAAMSRSARALARPDAADRIAEELVMLAKRRREPSSQPPH
jgi:UDP-N-acetylglucosamine--N-acetylmuramyl-(pentapeptide) pyrophosphoryl-undecaprenol N-acetylglucosamine transferase